MKKWNIEWLQLMDEFHCLWDPQHPGFHDRDLRTQACQVLLEKYNSQGSPVDMVTMKLWLAAFHRLQTGRFAKGVCMQCHAKSEDIAVLLPEFPCLWDFEDLNFFEEAVKARCRKKLLKKYNKRAQKIGMGTLICKLYMFNQNRIHCSSLGGIAETGKSQESTIPRHELMAALLMQFPCLWNPEDLNFLDSRLKQRAREQLLVEFNVVANIPIGMEEVKRILKILNYYRRKSGQLAQNSTKRMDELMSEFPCLSDPHDPHPQYKDDVRARAWKRLLKRYNAVSSVHINMAKLKRKVRLFQRRKNQPENTAPPSTDLVHGHDSQHTQTYDSTESANKFLKPSNENVKTGDYYMASDGDDTDFDCKDIKFEPISVTDTEFVKQSIDVGVRDDGKQRVYVDFSCLSSDDNYRNDDERNDIDSKDNDYELDSLYITDIDVKDDITEDIDKKVEIDFTHEDNAAESLHGTAERNTVIRHTKMVEACGESISEESSLIEDSEMWYSVELPNIFR